MKKTQILLSFQLFLTVASFGQVGDLLNIETGLQNRSDILFYEGFSTTSWPNNWVMASEGGNTTKNDAGFDGSCLNVYLKKGAYGASGSGNTSMSSFLKNFTGVQTLHDEMYFRYYVYLDPNFDFSQGGKLPGMACHNLYGAGGHPTGNDGWTARYMWNSYGEMYLYAYLPLDGGWGTHIYCDYPGNRARLQRGKWHCIEQYIKLNTVTGAIGNADGKCYTWLDGNQCMKLENVVYRTVVNDAGKEFGIYSSIFFGGADAEWTPSYDTFIRIDNMVLAKNYIGPRIGTNVLSAPTIETQSGTFNNPVDVTITANNGDEIRYTTNGQEPNYWSAKYTSPIKIVKDATIKARTFSNSNNRYSAVATKTFTVNTTAGTTTTTKNASADSYIRNGSYESTNYGTEGTLEFKSSSFSYDRRAVVKFPLSDLTTVSSAKLRIYANSANASTKIGFFEMSSNWTESGITSLNAPICGDLTNTSTVSAAGWIEIDVTNYISSCISQGETEAAFFLMIMNIEDENKAASLRSRTASSNKPELVVKNASITSTQLGDVVYNSFSIFRNNGNITIDSDKNGTINIYDIQGKKIVSVFKNSRTISIPDTYLKSGLFIAQIISENGEKQSVKFMK